MAINLLKIGVQSSAKKDSPETMAAASPSAQAAVSPSTNPAPSPTSQVGASVAKPVGLGAFLKAAQSGKPIQAPVAKEAHPPAEPAERIEVEVVEARGPEGFKATLEKLDAMIGSVMRVERTDFDIVRGYVASVMTELKEMPEYRGFVRAKDVHNLMKFVQASSSQAENQFKVSSEKKEKKAVAKKKASSFNLEAFGDVPQKRMNLDALSGMNTDDIAVKK